MAERIKMMLSGCTRGCSLNPGNLPGGLGELVHRWIEDRTNNPTIIARAAEMGVKLTSSSITRHKSGHMHPVAEGAVVEGEDVVLSELEVIDRLIQRGAREANLATSRVSAEQLLRAIELKMKLTAGSVFDKMYDAMMGQQGPDDDDLEDIPEPGAAPEPPAPA